MFAIRIMGCLLSRQDRISGRALLRRAAAVGYGHCGWGSIAALRRRALPKDQVGEQLMKALMWCGPEDVRIEDVERPSLLEPDDALLRVTTAAICGSDLHLYHGKIPKLVPGIVLGHEFMGVVEEVGPAVRLVKP